MNNDLNDNNIENKLNDSKELLIFLKDELKSQKKDQILKAIYTGVFITSMLFTLSLVLPLILAYMSLNKNIYNYKEIFLDDNIYQRIISDTKATYLKVTTVPIEEFLKLVNHTLSLNLAKTKPRNC